MAMHVVTTRANLGATLSGFSCLSPWVQPGDDLLRLLHILLRRAPEQQASRHAPNGGLGHGICTHLQPLLERLEELKVHVGR